MEKSVVRIALFGLLLALVTTLPNKDDWDIYSFHINSTVTSRYAVTVITSRVVNRMEESKEIEFKVRIPKNAFISKFKMLIDGKEYDGVVKAKEQAQQQYSDAVSRGESAGLVSSVGRTLEEFKTSVTVAAHKKITFELTYEELLKRRLGKYELQIHARPMQPVRDFKVDVHINEKVGINFLDITGGLSTNALANAITKTLADKEAWVYFYPTEDQQKTCEGCGDQGLNGDLVISYDVNRDGSQGEIMTSDGYFVHHFAPSNLERISKNVVFVIDQSGSMHGRKIQQTRIALIHILNDLAEDDFFGLITFDSNIFHWKRELVQANRENVESAKRFAQNIRDNGATNINTALLEGTQMLNAHPREGSASILILLTDGDPTTGVTNLESIQSNVKRAIAGKFPLYCLGFGFDVNFEFLESMSLQNNGAARRIYEDADADLQLKGFYEEVATPLLTDVTLIYGGGTNLTQTNFSQYYNGSEIVVAGEITDNDILTLRPQVVGISNNRRIVFPESNAPVKSDSHIERVWAYLTVKQLMEKELQLSGPEKENVKKEAMRLSLKYNFVTPHTSMVVTKPPGENTDVLHKPKEGQASQQWDRAHMPTSSGQNYGYHPAVPPMLLPGAPGQIGPPGSGGSYSSPPVGGGVMSGLPGRVGSYGSPPVGGGVMFGLPGGGGVFGSSGRRGGYGGPPGHSRDLVGSNVLGYDTQGLPPLIKLQDVLAAPYPGLAATVASPQTMPAPVNSKLLLKAENQSTPLCFDVTGGLRLKLLHDPSSELSVNGELDSSAHGAFTRIMIHSGPELRIEVDNNGFSVTQGTITSYHTGQDSITIGGVTVISRDKEIDVAAGDIRLVILIHQKGGNKFLWPVLRQQLQDSNSEGILALKPVYEKVQTIPITKLKINNQEIDVTRSSATDFSIVSTPTVSCWFVSTDSALQRRLEDFIVTLL